MNQTIDGAHSWGNWRSSGDVWALADCERHLGHVIRVEAQWVAYDGTRLSESGVGFRIIGAFPDIDSARIAVELASIRMPATARMIA
jgi:hypothetical protein